MESSGFPEHAPIETNPLPRPSETWTATSLIHPTLANAINKFISVLNLQALCCHANSIRNRSDCSIEEQKFQSGKDHVVFELVFGDGVCWIARIPVPSESGYSIGKEEMKSEIATINFIRQHSTVPIPEIHGYNLDDGNRVGAPYIIFHAVPGRTMNILPLVDDNVKGHIYRQVASLMLQLSHLPAWPLIGFLQQSESDTTPTISKMALPIRNLPSQCAVTSARAFFEVRGKCFLDRKLAEGHDDKITVAWLYREAIPQFLQDGFHHQFPLCHADFGNCNILYDDDHNITGVIDWTWAQSGPWEHFACFPHEFSRRFGPAMSLCEKSRALFLKIFEEEESQWDPKIPLTQYMRSKAGRIAELTQDYQHINDGTWLPMDNIRELIKLMYGDDVDWEDIKRMAKADLEF